MMGRDGIMFRHVVEEERSERLELVLGCGKHGVVLRQSIHIGQLSAGSWQNGCAVLPCQLS